MNINELKDAARRFLSASQNNQWQQGPNTQWQQQGQGQGYSPYGQGQGQQWQGAPQQARGTVPPNPYYNPQQGQYPPPQNYQGPYPPQGYQQPYPPQGYQQPYPPQQQGGGFWGGIGGSIAGGLAGGIAGSLIGDALFDNHGGYDAPREEIVNNYYEQPQPDFNQGQQDMSGGWDNSGDVGGWDNGGDSGGWDNGGDSGGNDGGGW